MTQETTTHREQELLPLWSYVLALVVMIPAALMFRMGDERVERLGLALFLVWTVYVWGMGIYWLRAKLRQSAAWESRPLRFWISVSPVFFLVFAWPTLMLAAIMTDLQKALG
jgi:hypothetical protein